MKKLPVFLFFSMSLSLAFTSPWVDDAFVLVETENPARIKRTIATDYSFRDFTRYEEKENLLMAALKNSRGNDVIDLLLKNAKISPDSKTKNDVTALMYACQYESDIEAVENVLFTGAKSDEKKAARILSQDDQGLNCFDYAYKNETISQEVLALLRSYADEPVKEVQENLSPEIEEEVPEEADAAVDAEVLPPPATLDLTPESPEPEDIPEEKNQFLDFTAMKKPDVIPESIYLYDYANDKYAALLIPPALIAAEEASRKFIQDANAVDSDQRTKLMYAAQKGDIELIENLLYSGAKINARDEEGWTALMYAARFQRNPDVTKLLLYKGADREIKNNYGLTALLLAAGYSENSEVISTLLDSYAPDSEAARSALAYGISNMNAPEVLRAFTSKRVPLNIPYNGKTPLMLACQTGNNTKVIEWLLNNGASKYQIESSTGKTAFDYARENNKLPHNLTYWSLNPNS
ncbi:MAG: ankyrin repeat domain-containing protein [Treponema sp.]|nr:ankyrin repeat domain-containing protein [Treponema sp.]